MAIERKQRFNINVELHTAGVMAIERKQCLNINVELHTAGVMMLREGRASK